MKDKDIEEKIDDLAQIVARGFTEVREDMATKADLADLREEMRETFATKEDLIHPRGDIDIMLDRHIGSSKTCAIGANTATMAMIRFVQQSPLMAPL